ncbi:MAG TPA: TIGR03086 family metal-binding protein [Actinomycetota bacterium]|nr:TIGR03086 family metal-binding protein [Actinomycetota bacterium]
MRRLPNDDEVPQLFTRGAVRFSGLVGGIGEDRWTLPTPCEGWDVRTLVQHIVHELLWVPDLFAGKTIEEVGDRFEGEILGRDPVASYRRAMLDAVDAISEPDALERIVHLSYGDMPGGHYAFELSNDLWIHGWDLARAIGADDRIDDDVAATLYRFYEPLEPGLKASGMFGPRVDPPADADVQTKLLAVMGRRAW